MLASRQKYFSKPLGILEKEPTAVGLMEECVTIFRKTSDNCFKSAFSYCHQTWLEADRKLFLGSDT